jgi:hypothetical protein
MIARRWLFRLMLALAALPVLAGMARAEGVLHVVSAAPAHYPEASKQVPLPTTAVNAREVARLFERQQGRLFREVRAHVLVDGQATRAAILEALDRLQEEVKAGDLVVLYLAGHGGAVGDGSWSFAPFDFDPERPGETDFRDRDLAARLGRLPAPALVFLESCHSGQAGRSLTAAANVAWFFACQADEEGVEVGFWQSGLFTQALVEGLEGRADADGDGLVTVGELDAYIRARSGELMEDFKYLEGKGMGLESGKPHVQHPGYRAAGAVSAGQPIVRTNRPARRPQGELSRLLAGK